MAAGVMVMQRGASAAPLRPRRSVGEYALHSISLPAGVNAEVVRLREERIQREESGISTDNRRRKDTEAVEKTTKC
jgi:hypothetical protein